MNVAAKFRTRRNRKTEGGAFAQVSGLVCGVALIAGLVQRIGPALTFPLCKTCPNIGFWGGRLGRATLAALTLPALVAADPIPLPSGHSVILADVIWEDQPGQRALVLRYLDPDIARDTGNRDYTMAAQDMDQLCALHAPKIANLPGARADTVVVVLMDRPVPRGEAKPEATQFIASYALDGDTCIWEEL